MILEVQMTSLQENTFISGVLREGGPQPDTWALPRLCFKKTKQEGNLVFLARTSPDQPPFRFPVPSFLQSLFESRVPSMLGQRLGQVALVTGQRCCCPIQAGGQQ